jgi:transcriptional regulator with XRE-family HTH domain
MTSVSENIKFLRKKAGFTQEQFAEKIGIKRSLVGAYEEGRADPRLNNLTRMAEVFGTSVDILINKDVSRMRANDIFVNPYERGKHVLAITTDAHDKENIELVPQKASAGYLNGFADPEYISELPKFQLPFLPKNATYRAFEISGDSMLPVVPGTIIVGEYVDNLKHIKNGNTYVLVTKKEGVVYKRVFNYLEEKGKLFLVSDNKVYAPYDLAPDEVLEVWSAKAFISVQFPEGNFVQENTVSVDQLASMVLELQKEVTRLKRSDA